MQYKTGFHTFVLMSLLLCSCSSDSSKSVMTAEKAYEGVSNYCHYAYDWSVAKDNPDVMYIEMGEETDSAYQVVFRSYTGALVLFYVDKESGIARMVEKVPSLNVEEEAGSIDLADYLGSRETVPGS